jgi:hypothetical protein
MKKIIVITAALAVAACAQNPATSLSSVGALTGSAGVPGVNGGQSVNAGPLVQKLNESMLNMSMAQKHTFEAFGLKREAEQAASNAKAFETGNSIDAEVIKRTSDADVKISEEIAKNKKISAQGKAKLAKALPYYSKAMLQSAGLGMQMNQAVVSISANPMSLASGPYKANELITVFTASPKLLTQMSTTTRNLATYASANGVDTKEVNSNLKDLK